MATKPSYYAIIPADVRYSKVSDGAKLLYGEITALANAEGYCWAGDNYFAKLYGKSRETISRRIQQLEELGFIRIEKVMTNKGWSRKIFIAKKASDENDTSEAVASDKNVTSASDKNVTYNNTSTNNTNTTNVVLADAGEKPDRRNPDVQRIIEAWSEAYHTEPGANARRYAFLLARKRGADRVIGAIQAARSVLEEQYAPAITSLEDLHFKWNNLEVFFVRKQKKQQTRTVEITDN